MNRIVPMLLVAALFSATAKAQTSATKARLNHTAIYVKDLAASTFFYQTVLGLDTIANPFHDGKHTWLRTGPGTALHIIQGAPERKEYYKNQHTCFSVASVDAFISVLKKYNLRWEDRDGKKQAVTTRVDGVKQLWVQDPDGYWVEVNDARE
jgi:lactoylglutathione lyase